MKMVGDGVVGIVPGVDNTGMLVSLQSMEYRSCSNAMEQNSASQIGYRTRSIELSMSGCLQVPT